MKVKPEKEYILDLKKYYQTHYRTEYELHIPRGDMPAGRQSEP